MREVGLVGAAPRALSAGRNVVGSDPGGRGPANENLAQVQRSRTWRRRLPYGREHVRPHFVALAADRRPKVHRQLLGPAPEGFGHCREPRFQHARSGPAPAGVQQSRRASGRVGHEDGHAVGQCHRKQQTRRAGGVSVAVPGQHESAGRCVVHAHATAVHLPAAQHGAPRPSAVEPTYGMGGDLGAGPAGGCGTRLVERGTWTRPGAGPIRTPPARPASRPGPKPGKRGTPSGYARGRIGDELGGVGGGGHREEGLLLLGDGRLADQGRSVGTPDKVDWWPR